MQWGEAGRVLSRSWLAKGYGRVVFSLGRRVPSAECCSILVVKGGMDMYMFGFQPKLSKLPFGMWKASKGVDAVVWRVVDGR